MTWERDTLGSLGVEAQTGFASGKHSGVGELPHLRPMNITPHGALTLDGSKFVDAESGIQRVERGDVLFNNTNSPKWVGKTAWVNAAQELAYSNHMTRLRSPTHRLDSRFLASYLHFQQMSGYFEAICSNHVNQASVSRKRLLETEIPLPSLEEQRRIVAILEDHLSHLDTADGALSMVERRLQTLDQVMLSRCRDGRPLPLKDIALIQGGIQKQPKRVPKLNAYAFLRVANVTANGLDLNEVHQVELFNGELEKLRLERGDLLVVEGNGSSSQIGRAALWNDSIEDCVHQNHLIRVRPGSGLLPEYLEAVWNSPQNRRTLSNVASSSSGLHTLSVSKLKRLAVPVPSVERQRELVTEVDELRESYARQRSTIVQLQ